MPRTSLLCVAIMYSCTGQALAHKFYWPDCYIVTCFISWKPLSVPCCRRLALRLTPDASISRYS